MKISKERKLELLERIRNEDEGIASYIEMVSGRCKRDIYVDFDKCSWPFSNKMKKLLVYIELGRESDTFINLEIKKGNEKKIDIKNIIDFLNGIEIGLRCSNPDIVNFHTVCAAAHDTHSMLIKMVLDECDERKNGSFRVPASVGKELVSNINKDYSELPEGVQGMYKRYISSMLYNVTGIFVDSAIPNGYEKH